MTKLFFAIAIILTLLVACDTEEVADEEITREEDEVFSEEEAKALAKERLLESPTFNERGGRDLEITAINKLSENEHEIEATFQTQLAGYGTLENEEVIAPVQKIHHASVLVEDEVVVKVVLNEKFDATDNKLFVVLKEEEIDLYRAIIKSESEKRNQEILDEEELQEKAEDRALRTAIFFKLLSEWKIEVSDEMIEEYILKTIEADEAWERAGITDLETFFEFQKEERNNLQEEVMLEIKQEIGVEKLAAEIKENLEITDEKLEEVYEEHLKELENEHEEEVSIPPFDEKQIEGRIISDILIGELDRRYKKAVLILE